MSRASKTSESIPQQAGFFGIFIAALLILAACLWNYWYLIIETNDRIPERFQALVPSSSAFKEYEQKLQIGIYDSASTRRLYRAVRFDYSRVMATWENFLRSIGFAHRQFFKIDEIKQFDLVILPFTSCLSDYESDQIKEFVSEGGSLFMTGAVGSRHEDGIWRDEPVFGDIVGARFVGNANPSPLGPARLELNRNLPVSLRWTPRKSLEIPTYNEVLVTRPIGTRMKTVATAPYYRGEDSFDMLTAFCYGHYLGGRIAWSGFRIGAFQTGDETAERAFRELFSNVLAHLTDRPRVVTPTWPEDKSAAMATIVKVPEEDPYRFVAEATQQKRPVSLLVTPREVRQLGEHAGLGSLDIEWILHLDEGYMDTLQSPAPGWLEGLRAQVGESLNAEIQGVKIDGLRSREAALLALGAGFSYLLAPPTNNIEEYPEIYASSRKAGPLESPTVLSLAPYRTTVPESISPTDCFFVLLDGDRYLETDEFKPEGVSPSDVWFTLPIEIVNWRSDRNSVVMNEQFLPNDRLSLSISNGSYTEFTDFPFTIRFDRPVEKVNIWPKAVGLKPPKLLSRKGQNWTFLIEKFQPGRTLEYIFTPLGEGEEASTPVAFQVE
ncbi:MAG: hypothetical protein AAGJ81_09055 [Verrucomicrobiota bacterium]